jgi:hypothetical protein
MSSVSSTSVLFQEGDPGTTPLIGFIRLYEVASSNAYDDAE